MVELFATDCAPAHADALNDLSSTPPVSSARHALVVFAEAGAVTPRTESEAATATAMRRVDLFKLFPPEGFVRTFGEA